MSEQCEYCDAQHATVHCIECGKALCPMCVIKDENERIRCLTCGETETIPLTTEDIEDESVVTPFERPDDD